MKVGFPRGMFPCPALSGARLRGDIQEWWEEWLQEVNEPRFARLKGARDEGQGCQQPMTIGQVGRWRA